MNSTRTTPTIPVATRKLRQVVLLIAVSAWHSAQAADDVQGRHANFPGRTWESVPHEALDPSCRQRLDAAHARLKAMDTTSLMAVQNGKVLFSYGPTDLVSILFSARKSLLAMLYGKYVDNGTIILQKTLFDLGIDDVGGLLPIERNATLEHLLSARSGVYHAAANSGDDSSSAPQRGSQAPGTYFLYNNWDFNAAGTAFELLTKQSIYRTFTDDLAIPLGLEDFDLARHRKTGDSAKSEHLAYHFLLSTRDMARLGYLMLQHGNWRGNQLIPTNWVDQLGRAVTSSREETGPREKDGQLRCRSPTTRLHRVAPVQEWIGRRSSLFGMRVPRHPPGRFDQEECPYPHRLQALRPTIAAAGDRIAAFRRELVALGTAQRRSPGFSFDLGIPRVSS